MAVSGIFASGAVFVFLMFTLGNLLIVICGITSLIVLPLAIGKKSRFQQYLLSLLENSRGINLNSVKKKSRKGFIVLCLLYVETVTFSIVSDQKLNFGLACCKPWNEWYGFRVIAQFSLFTGSAVWLLSMYFFYLTCRILLKCFDGLYKRMSSLPPLSANFTSLKMEHHRLCEVVELADKMLAPLLLGVVALYIPMLCISFYNSVIFREDMKLMALATTLSWCFVAAGILATVLFFGSKVNEKVCQGKHVFYWLSYLWNILDLKFYLNRDGGCRPFVFCVFFYYALVHVLKFHNLTFVFQIHSFQSILQTMPVSTAEEAKVTSIF